jgi:hypothetical protein
MWTFSSLKFLFTTTTTLIVVIFSLNGTHGQTQVLNFWENYAKNCSGLPNATHNDGHNYTIPANIATMGIKLNGL